MPQENFLESVYQGSLRKDVFASFETPCNAEKVHLLVERFRELLKDYSPRDIEAEGRIPGPMLKKMGEIGLFGISIPEAYGGLGFNLWEYLKVVEEMVRLDISTVLASLAHLSIGIKGIILFGTEAQKQKYLPPAASGDMIFSYALTEPKIGSDAQHIETRAELSEDGTHYILNGQKTYITNANYAGGLTVFAQMDPDRPGFMGAFIVETEWSGVKIGKDMPKMGLKASSTAAIQFHNVRVPVENLLGRPGEGFKIAMTVLNYGRLGLGAASVGMMKVSLEDMIKRSSSRIQFGVPINHFPLIREKLVKAKVYSLVSSAMNEFTAHLLNEHPTANVALESSHCKLFGTTRAWDVLYEALQVAGGSGYLSTQPYEKRMRDFRVATVFEGTTEIHSIYPSLAMMRKIGGQLRHAGWKGRQFLFLMRLLFRRMEWTLQFENKTMNRALKLARRNAVGIRKMIVLGLILHGKRAAQNQFLLRRISMLSLYSFGLLAVLCKLAKSSGSEKSEGLLLLEYFLEEAKEAGKINNRVVNTRKENLITRIFMEFR